MMLHTELSNIRQYLIITKKKAPYTFTYQRFLGDEVGPREGPVYLIPVVCTNHEPLKLLVVFPSQLTQPKLKIYVDRVSDSSCLGTSKYPCPLKCKPQIGQL